MNEKNTLQQIGTISHEIRNPLAGIIELSRLLLDSGLNSMQENYVKTIFNTSSTLLMILNDFVDFAKIEANALVLNEETFCAQEIVRDVARVMTPMAAAKGVNIFAEINTEEIPPLIGDIVKIKQILFNLTSNAIKFTDSGSVTIAMNITKDNLPNIYKLTCSVTDTGVGFDIKEKDELFKKFSQLKNQRGGSGLGLCICKKLVDFMSGDISVKTQKGKGTCFSFTLTLPADTKEGHEFCTLEKIEPLKILLAEDNPVSRKVTTLMLEKDGHIVTSAQNGREAIEKATETAFDLILMDMTMPEIDGVDATRAIRSLADKGKASVPILAMTGKDMDTDRKSCKEVGMNGFLQKPLDKNKMAKLWQKIKRKSL